MLKFRLLMVSVALLLSGCYLHDAGTADNIDPYEAYNRKTFAMNEQLDQRLFEPLGYFHSHYVPDPLAKGVHNFFMNLVELPSAINAGLQNNWAGVHRCLFRFGVNSIFGFGGLFEMADALGLPRQRFDFGQTMYHHGYRDSAYVVTLFLGPATVRDAWGATIDQFWNPRILMAPSWTPALIIGDLLDTKITVAEYLKEVPDLAVNDRYVFMRDLFLQYRNFHLHEGEVDWDKFYDQPDS